MTARMRHLYLIDTNVISEARKRDRADPGVIAFFRSASVRNDALYLSAVTIGELRRGVVLIRRRGDLAQAALLESWLGEVVGAYGSRILALDTDAAQVWGRLRVPDPQPALDKQIAAIALVNDLTVVTRNVADFGCMGGRVKNPFSATIDRQ